MSNITLPRIALGALLTVFGLPACDAASTPAPETDTQVTQVEQSEANEPNADFELPELKSVNLEARPASCAQSTTCARGPGRDEGPSASCVEAAQACLRDLAGRTSTIVEELGSCRKEAVSCLREGGEREACANEFRTCSKTAVEEATVREGQKAP